jgi:dipeptidyl aminopeptidase/acylaminoacyl peptidase
LNAIVFIDEGLIRAECRQLYRVRANAISLCIISVCFLNSARSYAAELEGARSGESRLVSIDAILERKVPSVRDVRWYRSEELVAEFTDLQSGKTVTRSISLNGMLGAPVGSGKHTSMSPDGRSFVQQTDDGWVIRDLEARQTVQIDRPANEDRDFSSHTRPVWSPDGRYVAILAHYRPRGPQYTPEVTEVADVPIIDVSSQAPFSELWTTRVTIIDRLEPAEPQQFFVDDMATRMRWGSDNVLFVTQTNFFGHETATSVLRIEPGSQHAEAIYRSRGRFQTMIPAVHPDGNMIALVLDADNRTWEDFSSILLIDVSSGDELRRLTDDVPVLGEDYVWSVKGDEIYARVRNGGLDSIYAFPLDGEPRPLAEGGRRHFNLDLSSDGGQLSYQTEDGYGRKDIRVLDLKTGEEKVILVQDEPAKEFKLVVVQCDTA